MESVTMHQNGITPDGIEALAESFLHSPNIRIINLCDNTVKLKGGRALAKVCSTDTIFTLIYCHKNNVL